MEKVVSEQQAIFEDGFEQDVTNEQLSKMKRKRMYVTESILWLDGQAVAILFTINQSICIGHKHCGLFALRSEKTVVTETIFWVDISM